MKREKAMNIGLSSACFYPLETEKSLIRAAETGAKAVEIFMNADSEFTPRSLNLFKSIKDEYGIEIPSVHTMASFTESYYLFSSYRRRYMEARETLFKRHFEVMHRLGADILVMHGIKLPGSISDEEYFERFGELILLGEKEGLKVCQENVVHYRSESPDFLLSMAQYIGGSFNMVFDIKQSVRAGFDPFEFSARLHPYIRHIHISDHSAGRDCIVPFSGGSFDFKRFFSAMKGFGYKGKYILELYENGYENDSQLAYAVKELEKLF